MKNTEEIRKEIESLVKRQSSLDDEQHDISEKIRQLRLKLINLPFEGKYIKYTDKNDKQEILKDILKFLRVCTPEKIYELETNNIYFKSNNDKQELLMMWLEKCYRESLKQRVGENTKH